MVRGRRMIPRTFFPGIHRFFLSIASSSSSSPRFLLHRPLHLPPPAPAAPCCSSTPSFFPSWLNLSARPWSSSPAPAASAATSKPSYNPSSSPPPPPPSASSSPSSAMDSSDRPPDYDDCVFDADDKDYKGEPESDPEETYLFSPSDSEN